MSFKPFIRTDSFTRDSSPKISIRKEHIGFNAVFVKIVWVGPGGSLWGEYEIIQRVLNDPKGGVTGLEFPVVAPGFGLNDQWTITP